MTQDLWPQAVCNSGEFKRGGKTVISLTGAESPDSPRLNTGGRRQADQSPICLISLTEFGRKNEYPAHLDGANEVKDGRQTRHKEEALAVPHRYAAPQRRPSANHGQAA
jgi:hypothetical protein